MRDLIAGGGVCFIAYVRASPNSLSWAGSTDR